MPTKRRTFLKQVTLASAAAQAAAPVPAPTEVAPTSSAASEFGFPRAFTGRRLTAIAFRSAACAPGASASEDAGSFAIGRFFNRPDKGNAPPTPSRPSGRRPATASPSPACSNPASSRLRGFQRPWSAQCAGPHTPGLGHLHRRIPAGASRLLRFRPAREVSLEAFSPFIPTNRTIPAYRSPSCVTASPTPARRQPRSRSPGPSKIPPAALRQGYSRQRVQNLPTARWHSHDQPGTARRRCA